MKVQLPDGTQVEAKQLIEPIGQFTHWYLNQNGEPRYLIIRSANDNAYMFNEDVNRALTAALASGRYLIAVFTIDAAENGADRTCHLHRVSHQFPYDAFEFAKTELAKNLDGEYQPPKKLQLADFVAQGMPADAVAVDEEGRELKVVEGTPSDLPEAGTAVPGLQVIPDGEPRPLGQIDNLQGVTNAKNDALVQQLQQMNSEAEAKGDITTEAPKANVVEDIDEPVVVAHDPLAKQGSEQGG